MINYSSSFLFRARCKHCFGPPCESRNYSGIDLGIKDLIKESKEWGPDIYIPPEHIIESYLKHLRYKINLNNFNYVRSVNVNSRFHRKKKNNDNAISPENIPKICRCKCAKSYWIVFNLDKEIYPEYNKKSRYKYKI